MLWNIDSWLECSQTTLTSTMSCRRLNSTSSSSTGSLGWNRGWRPCKLTLKLSRNRFEWLRSWSNSCGQMRRIRLHRFVLLCRQVTEGGAFKALTRYTGNHNEADERFAGLLQWISGQIVEINENDVLEYRRTTVLSSTDMDWLNSEQYSSRQLTRRWHPSTHWKKRKSRELLAGSACNVKREDAIMDIELNRRRAQKVC